MKLNIKHGIQFCLISVYVWCKYTPKFNCNIKPFGLKLTHKNFSRIHHKIIKLMQQLKIKVSYLICTINQAKYLTAADFPHRLSDCIRKTINYNQSCKQALP